VELIDDIVAALVSHH